MKPCDHNTMVRNGTSTTHVWKCSNCGYVYGLTMTKTIRVIKTKKGYVENHEYSQGYSTYSTTSDYLKALDLNNTKLNTDFIVKCIFSDQHREDEPVIEEYDVMVTPHIKTEIPMRNPEYDGPMGIFEGMDDEG